MTVRFAPTLLRVTALQTVLRVVLASSLFGTAGGIGDATTQSLSPSMSTVAAPPAPAPATARDDADAALENARQLEKARDWNALVEILSQRARRYALTPEEERLFATGLEQVGRLDEAAHHMDLCAVGYERLGRDKESKAAIVAIRRLDPLSTRRDPFVRKVSSTLLDAAQELLAGGDAERALRIAEGLPGIARGKEVRAAADLLARARAAFEKIELASPAEPGAEPTAARPVVERETEHYRLECCLEPDVVERLGKLMDDIHAFYVRVYFDGDAKRARGAKAKIIIAPDKAAMLLGWEGDGGPDGWWSPGAGEVHAYDSRPTTGSLDAMLETLFHEASHQFMTMLAGAGNVPAWLNEGTSSFFEGTVAMADGRVLWPRAAMSRLGALQFQIASKQVPRLRDVIQYDAPGSYQAEYYAWGWGLVYFLQEYEDPKTLEQVYRPLYSQYRSEVIQKGHASFEMFESWFLGKRSPLDHQDFATFERAWESWILDEVGPLHRTDAKARALRLARIDRLVGAADALAASGKKTKGGPRPEDFLERALVHFEWVRTEIDKDKPDAELLLRQADVFERLTRNSSSAALIETVLELASSGKIELDEQRRAELEARVAKLDRKNAALRTARRKTSELARTALALVADYRTAGFTMRASTLAAELAAVLGEPLEPVAAELREEARAKGLLLGTIRGFASAPDAWKKLMDAPLEVFEPKENSAVLSGVRAGEMVDASFEVRGEYVVRATIVPRGEREMGWTAGLVVAGDFEQASTMVGIDDRGFVGLYTLNAAKKGAATLRRTRTITLSPPVPPGEPVELSVRVRADGAMEIHVGDRPSIDARLELAPVGARYAGLFVRNANALFEDPRVELLP